MNTWLHDLLDKNVHVHELKLDVRFDPITWKALRGNDRTVSCRIRNEGHQKSINI